MENNIYHHELDELKKQFSILNRKLEQEAIINDRLIRKIVADKYSKVNKKSWQFTMIAIFSAIIMPPLLIKVLNTSVLFTCITALFMLIAAAAEYYTHKKVTDTLKANGSLLETGKEALKLKRFNKRWLFFIGIPFICVWVPCYYRELVNGQTLEDPEVLISSIIIGVTVGGVIGIMKFIKEQRALSAIIKDIEEMQR